LTITPFPGRHNLDRRALAIIEEANRGSDDELLSTPQVAVLLGVSPEWLEIGRGKGWGPPYLRLSPRRLRYSRGAVRAWLQERAYRHTGQYADPAKPRSGRAAGSRVVDGKVVQPESTGDGAA
jgi:predicted DNA-binding transcriptional regulator AlpA